LARWLLKTEPSEYSFDDLLKAKSGTWDGVSNAVALKHLRSMNKGDQAIIYHTGDERSCIGRLGCLDDRADHPVRDRMRRGDRDVGQANVLEAVAEF